MRDSTELPGDLFTFDSKNARLSRVAASGYSNESVARWAHSLSIQMPNHSSLVTICLAISENFPTQLTEYDLRGVQER